MNQITTKTIREIALEAPATTRVFEEFRIDYCCGGHRSIADASAAKGIDSSMLIERIGEAITESNERSTRRPPEYLKPSELVDYIVLTKHHVFTPAGDRASDAADGEGRHATL